MFGFRRRQDRIFHLQDDGRFGSVKDDSLGIDSEVFLPSKSGTFQGRGPVSLGVSISPHRRRLGLLLVFTIAFLFMARSAHLQVIQGAQFAEKSVHNKEFIELLGPARGLILDKDGTPLAWNEPAFVLTMTASQLPDADERAQLFRHVADLIGVQPTDLDLLLSLYASRPDDPIPLVDDLAFESAMRLAVEVSQLPGFSLTTRIKRVYNSSTVSLSHILGYTGLLTAQDLAVHEGKRYRLIDRIGKLGIEQWYEELLRGAPGALVYEVNALGQKQSILSRQDPVVGSTLTLALDLELQAFIEGELQAHFEQTTASRGSVVALDPQTGAVRALVSLPSFDSNEFSEGISQSRYQTLLEDPDNPLFFRGISGEFPSGSTFKPIVAYAALAQNVVGEHTSFLSTGGLRIGQWFFPDWKAGGHGITDVRKAISESVNTYFYIIGGGFDTVTGLGVERIVQYAQTFGFGSPTGIDLPSEADGFLPTKEWKQDTKGERWYVGDTYHLAIGQGDFLTTPLQMAVATSVVANGGKRVTPYIVESADGFGTDRISHVQPMSIDGLDAYALSLVRQGMRQTITTGSARSLASLSEAVAGKTGTAQTLGDKPYHSWFTGFGPYEEPSLVLVVLIEEGGESNDAAVPLAKRIFNWWFQYGDS